ASRLNKGGSPPARLSRKPTLIRFGPKAAWRFVSRGLPKSALFHSRSLAVWTRSLAEVKNSLDCGGRAQRRHRFARQSASESDVALRFPPQSKTPGTATECSPSHGPFIQYSIIAAVAGSFGDTHSTERTEGSSRFINPLMALYWGFRLDGVVHRNLYLDQIRNTETAEEFSLAIERF